MQIEEIQVRSPMTCEASPGICRRCYGMDLSSGHLAEPGMAAGIIAAQSGRGEVARLAVLLDEQRRSERVARSVAWRAEEARRAVAEAHLRELDGLADLMKKATLLAAGFHRHDRGAWRRRRMSGKRTEDGMGSDAGKVRRNGTAQVSDEGTPCGDRPAPVEGPGGEDRPLTEGEFRDLVGRAVRGDRTVLPALRRLFDAAPNLWKHCGDVARHAEAAWVGVLAGGDLLVRESLTGSVAALKSELAGPGAPPLERLLAERVAASWLQASKADAAFAQLKGQDLTAAQLEMCQRRQERAQRSYLEAIKAMATVRRLTVTAPRRRGLRCDGRHGVGTGRGRPDGGRDDGVRASATAGGTKSRGDRKGAGKGKAARGGSAVPKALRDRMRGSWKPRTRPSCRRTSCQGGRRPRGRRAAGRLARIIHEWH